MNTIPVELRKRPFAVEPFTGIMMPDGIFDTAIFNQDICCYFVNQGTQPLSDVDLFAEGIGDAGISITSDTHTIREWKPGAAVLLRWRADFRNASVGKKILSIVVRVGSVSKRILKTLFVSSTTYDRSSDRFYCQVPEGTFAMKIRTVAGTRRRGPEGDGPNRRWHVGPWLPMRVEIVLITHPFPGRDGPIPFEDPWWKIVAWIVAAICAIGAVIAAELGEGTATIQVSGEFDESSGDIDCCKPDPKETGKKGGRTVAGVLSAVAAGAMTVGLSDEADPIQRGRLATAPDDASEITTSEKLSVELEYDETAFPNAGEAFPVDVQWSYERQTDKRVYKTTIREVQQNVHAAYHPIISAPAKIKFKGERFIVSMKLERKGGPRDGQPFVRDELYVFALAYAPGLKKDVFRFPLCDDGRDPDTIGGDGTYSGELDLERIEPILREYGQEVYGEWKIYVFAQDVNDWEPPSGGGSAIEAAKHIGGFFVVSGVRLTPEGSASCPLVPHAVVRVIQ